MMMIASPKAVALRTCLLASKTTFEPLGRGQFAAKFVLPFAEHAQAVFDDDDGPVDDQAEVDRAQAHQVAADLPATMPLAVMQHRKRDRQRRDDRGADVAEQDEQDDDDEDRPFDQVFGGRCGWSSRPAWCG